MGNLIAVTTTGVNMHEAASKDSPNVAVLPKDAQLSILGNTGTYLQGEYNGQIGYIYMELAQPQAASDASIAWTTIVISPELNLRSGPAREASSLGTLPKNEQAAVVGYTGTWLRVLAKGQTGYISADCTAAGSPAQVQALTAALAPVGIVPPDTPSDSLPKAEIAIKARLAPEEIAGLRASIAQEPDERVRGDRYEDLQGRVIYASQRDNQARYPNGSRVETKSGNMCNLTSLSMALAYLGFPNPKPNMQYEDALEMLRQENRLPDRTTSEGWGGVAHVLGAQAKIFATAVKQGHDWWDVNVRQRYLRQGAGVIMSIGGHIVRVQGVTDQGLVIDDPYGRCRVLAGEQGAWKYSLVNEYDKPGQTAGEDSLWPWADVAQHTMRWIAAIAPAPAVLGDEEPIEHVEDDGVVMEGAQV